MPVTNGESSVNSVFNPEYVDMLYPRSASYRRSFIGDAKATNYGVVRLELIEHIYQRMYDQRRDLGRDDRKWPHRIMGGRKIEGVDALDNETLQINAALLDNAGVAPELADEESWEADLVIAATGYRRDSHLEMLRDTWEMLPESNPTSQSQLNDPSGWSVQTSKGEHRMAVGRNYEVQYKPEAVAPGSGIWLQGCCEATHGVSTPLPFDTVQVFADCRRESMADQQCDIAQRHVTVRVGNQVW